MQGIEEGISTVQPEAMTRVTLLMKQQGMDS